MAKQFTISTTYFLQEGRENLLRTLRLAFRAALDHKIGKIVIFTAQGRGAQLAADEFLTKPEYDQMRLIAVTFPTGKTFTNKERQEIKVEIPPAVIDSLRNRAIPIPVVRAHLPFDPISSPYRDRGALAQELSLVGDALNTFGGGMSLCVQAILMACDAGEIEVGEHVVSLASDCAILAQATSTRRMLRELTIREIICKPAILSITRGETADSTLPERPRRKTLTAKKTE